MDLSLLKRRSDYEWRIEPSGKMRVPGIIFADEALVRDTDHKVYEQTAAAAFRIREGDIVVSIHCGSRGLGHQIGTEFLKRMVMTAAGHGIELPDRELACAPIHSDVGRAYLGAMRAAINCALANRQIITHLVRQAFAEVLPQAEMPLLYDVSHNTCKVEEHFLDGRSRRLFVHRKGAGRAMSRTQASKQWKGRELVDQLKSQGILIRTPSYRGVAEEAPGAYKDVSAVVDAADEAKLARKVARLEPLVCIKG